MRTKNKIDLIGFVGRDPETSTTAGGSPVTHVPRTPRKDRTS